MRPLTIKTYHVVINLRLLKLILKKAGKYAAAAAVSSGLSTAVTTTTSFAAKQILFLLLSSMTQWHGRYKKYYIGSNKTNQHQQHKQQEQQQCKQDSTQQATATVWPILYSDLFRLENWKDMMDNQTTWRCVFWKPKDTFQKTRLHVFWLWSWLFGYVMAFYYNWISAKLP